MDTLTVQKNLFNEQTITVDGDIVFARIYTSMYPDLAFTDDCRPDYYIKEADFSKIINEIYGEVEQQIIYKNLISGGCSYILNIPSAKTMFFLHKIIEDDLVDRKYKLGAKDMEFIANSGHLGYLEDRLDTIPEEEFNAFKLSPCIDESEMRDVLVRTFYYPVLETKRAEAFCKLFDTYKFDRASKLNKGIDNTVFTLGITSSGALSLYKHYLDTSKYQEEIVQSNYNDNFKPNYDKIMSFLKTKESGLILLTGEPGTGKSSFLLHLTSKSAELKTRFVFVPSALAGTLSEPYFLTFAANSLNDSILIIEDADDILGDRAITHNPAVANILNLSDGIPGKVIKLKIIATINKSQVLDLALLRKGRLRLQYKFEKLIPDKANALLRKLGKDKLVTEPITLTEIYNSEENVATTVLPDTKKIGFK